MRQKDLWRSIFGLEQTIIERAYMDHDQGAIVVRVRPHSRFGRRCGVCRRPCPGYDRGGGLRRWRTLDLGEMMCFLEAESPRVHCRAHGVVAVPWARHNTGHTYAFDDQVAWLATHCSKEAVRELMRIAWSTVGAIIERVSADARKRMDLLCRMPLYLSCRVPH